MKQMNEEDKRKILTDIVNTYADFVSQNIQRLPFGIPESELPYPKESIQDAIEELYPIYYSLYERRLMPEAKIFLNLMETAYEHLAFFLPEPEIEFKGLPASDEQIKSYFSYTGKLAQRQEEYRQRVNAMKERLT